MSEKVKKGTGSVAKRVTPTGQFVAVDRQAGKRTLEVYGGNLGVKERVQMPVRSSGKTAVGTVRGTMPTAKPAAARGAGAMVSASARVVEAKRPARKHRSDLMASIHESMSGLHAEGHIDKATMREFDDLCLTPVEDFEPAEIVKIREAQAVSQAVFARYLNVSTSTVSKWEQGEKRPTSLGRKLLDLVRRKGLDALA